jgi:hypothetical protein
MNEQPPNGYNQQPNMYEDMYNLPDYGEMSDEPPPSLRLTREHRSPNIGNHIIPIMSANNWSEYENKLNRLLPCFVNKSFLVKRYMSPNNIVNEYIITRVPMGWSYHTVAYNYGEESPYHYDEDKTN